MTGRLILASTSPRRCELLKGLGINFDVIPSRVEEGGALEGESPREHVLRLADAKALDVAGRHPDQWVIGADTIVHLEGAVLGKPGDHTEALEMLSRLSGKEHRVLTAFSVNHLRKGKGDHEAVETEVKVKSLSRAEIQWYIQTREPFDKAGAYGIQGIGSFMIESIRGSYTNVVGLPVCELIEMLTRLGAIMISESGFHVLE